MTAGFCSNSTRHPRNGRRLRRLQIQRRDATLYRFFWSEYCDWYVEAAKAVLQGSDAARKANTLAVIDFVLSHTLRLFHPFLPFITEELWNGMGYAKDMPDDQGGKTIMFAPWPKALDEDFKSHYGLLAGSGWNIEAGKNW
jgi:valyl-tRNA synthetase